MRSSIVILIVALGVLVSCSKTSEIPMLVAHDVVGAEQTEPDQTAAADQTSEDGTSGGEAALDAGAAAAPESAETLAPDSEQADAAQPAAGQTDAAVNDAGDANADGEASGVSGGPPYADDESSPFLDGGTRAELPADQRQRIALMSDWLLDNIDESRGYALISGQSVSTMTYTIDVADGAQAAAWCEIFLGITDSYFFAGEVDEVVLYGSVPGPDGVYQDADWPSITC